MVEVCGICGDRGFTNALIYCSECSEASAHQYCLGIPPGSIEDNFDWVCDCCSQLVSESCQKFGGAFCHGALQSCSEHEGDVKLESVNKIVALSEQPEPLCTLLPTQYHEISTRENTSHQSQKQEAPTSSFMEHPDSIMRGLVLLVSPSGEVFIHSGMSFCDDPHFSSWTSHILNMTSCSNYIDSDKVKDELSLGKIVEKNMDYNSVKTIKLVERKLQTLDEINARLSEPANFTSITRHTSNSCEENIEDMVLLSKESSKLHVLKKKDKSGSRMKSFNLPQEDEVVARISSNKDEASSSHSTGSSMVDSTITRKKRKRITEPKVEVKQKKASAYKVDGDTEGPNSEPVRYLGTTVAPTKKMVRDQIVTVLGNAGWTVVLRPKRKGKMYINPRGKAYYSALKAYHALQKEPRKGKVGCGSDNSEFYFKPIPKKVLSVLSGC